MRSRTGRPLALGLLAGLLVAAVVGFALNRGRISSWLSRTNHPYVVLVSLDTLHVNWTGLFNPEIDNTPFLDEFRESGTVWESAYTQVPITLPSHTALMTGVSPSRLGVMRNGDVVPEGVTTLAEVFRASGYRTTGFVSLGVLSETYGLDQGFIDYHDPFATESDRWYRHADEILAPVETWLDAHSENPFFMWIHLSDPHEPYLTVDAPADATLRVGESVVGEYSLASKRVYHVEVTIPPGRHPMSFRSHREPHGDDRPETGIYLQLYSRERLERFTDAVLPGVDDRIRLDPSYEIPLENRTESPQTLQIAFSGGPGSPRALRRARPLRQRDRVCR